MADRPDPLSPPEGYGHAPGRAQGQPAVNDDEVLDVCSAGDWGAAATGTPGCVHEVREIWTIGCKEGEHAGRMAWCSCHARLAERTGITCLQCLNRGRRDVPMITTMVQLADGVPGGGIACVRDDLMALVKGPHDGGTSADSQPDRAGRPPIAPGRDRPDGTQHGLP